MKRTRPPIYTTFEDERRTYALTEWFVLWLSAKLSPSLLAQVLSGLQHSPGQNVLVGFDTADDAECIDCATNLAIVQTVDFFTPIVTIT